MEGDNTLAPGQAPPELQPEGPLNHKSKGQYTNNLFDHAKPA